jgi:hypothetical protein
MLKNIQEKLSEFTGLTMEDIAKELDSPLQRLQDVDEAWKHLSLEEKEELLKK